MLPAGISVNRLARYWKYAVFGTLVPGAALFIVAAPNLVWKEDPNPLWKMLAGLAGILCSVGVLLWLCRVIATVGSDVVKLWKESKAGAVLTFAGIALLARVLESFTGPHFYGWYPQGLVILLDGATPWIVLAAPNCRCPLQCKQALTGWSI